MKSGGHGACAPRQAGPSPAPNEGDPALGDAETAAMGGVAGVLAVYRGTVIRQRAALVMLPF
jgi:hypothetical protein